MVLGALGDPLAACGSRGLYRRARRNVGRVQVRHNTIVSPRLPTAFHGFTILQLSDLHADMSGEAMERVAELLPDLRYDICVMTGDYRGKTFGPVCRVARRRRTGARQPGGPGVRRARQP